MVGTEDLGERVGSDEDGLKVGDMVGTDVVGNRVGSEEVGLNVLGPGTDLTWESEWVPKKRGSTWGKWLGLKTSGTEKQWDLTSGSP